MSFRLRSGTEVKMPLAITSRSILAEPQLDLVEPGRIGRSEVQVDVSVLGEELLDLLRLVRRQVVGDHVDLLVPGLVGDDVGEEGDELCRGGAHGRLGKNLAGSWC